MNLSMTSNNAALTMPQIAGALQMIPQQPRLAPVGAAPKTPGATLSKEQLAKIDNAAQQFEGVFMGEMLKPMFQTVKTDSAFGGGQAEESYRGLLVQQYGKKIAEHGGLGLASFVKDAMIKIQEGAHK